MTTSVLQWTILVIICCFKTISSIKQYLLCCKPTQILAQRWKSGLVYCTSRVMEYGAIVNQWLARKAYRNFEKICSNATLSTTNFMRSHLWFIFRLHDENPASNCLSLFPKRYEICVQIRYVSLNYTSIAWIQVLPTTSFCYDRM